MWKQHFLYGEIDEEIFMKSPVGMEEIDQGHLQQTATNWLCQAARQFWILWIPSEPCRSLHFVRRE